VAHVDRVRDVDLGATVVEEAGAVGEGEAFSETRGSVLDLWREGLRRVGVADAHELRHGRVVTNDHLVVLLVGERAAVQQIDEGGLACSRVAEHHHDPLALCTPCDRLAVVDAADEAGAGLCGRQRNRRIGELPLDDRVEVRRHATRRHGQ
jgi:hypothetical protein